MPRKRTRSRRGVRESTASWSTRRLNSSQLRSRLRNSRDSASAGAVAAGIELPRATVDVFLSIGRIIQWEVQLYWGSCELLTFREGTKGRRDEGEDAARHGIRTDGGMKE